jgi:transcription elongation factor GreA
MEKKDELNRLRQAADWSKVEEFARDELAAHPSDGFYLRALEQALREQGKKEELPETWRVLVDDLDEEYPYAHWLANKLLEEGDRVQATSYLRRGLTGAIQAKDFDAVEEIWLELADLIPDQLEYFLGIAAELARKREKARAGELLQLLLPYYESGSPESLLRLLRRIADLMPRDERMRAETQRVYRQLYGGRRDLSYLMEQSGLMGDTPLPEAISRLEDYLPFGAGQCVFHREWETGVVSRLDPIAGKIVIDFPSKRGHSMEFELARKILESVAPNDLRALPRDEVHRLKDEDPTALVRAALRSCGGKASGRRLKEVLLGRAIPEKEWPGWWGTISRKLKVDPGIQVTGGGARVYELREEEVRYEDEIRARFEKVRKPEEKVDVFLEYLDHCRAYAPDENLLQDMTDSLRALQERASNFANRAEIAYVLERVAKIPLPIRVPESPTFAEVLGDPVQAASVMEGLRFPEHEERWARGIKEAHPEGWPALFAEMVLSPKVVVRDALADLLLETEEGPGRLRAAFEKTSAAPRDYPGPFIWFCQRWILRADEGKRFGQNPCGLLERLLRLLDHLAFAGRRTKGKAGSRIREHAAGIRAFVKKNGFRVIKDVLEGATPVAAESLRKALVSNAGVDPAARSEALRIIRTRFPHLAEADQEVGAAASLSTENMVLCTRATLERRREEFRRLTEVEIPANAREIEEARGHGDLSDNAEYQFAKERQAMLHDRARELREALLRSRPVDVEGVSTERVAFGTRVTLRSASGETVTYTVLGPGELESSREVLSYVSDEGVALLGREVGDRVELAIGGSPAEFEVVEIEKAVEKG